MNQNSPVLKALSCKQPWASMLLESEKCIETRPRNTNFRGVFVLHASKKPDNESMQFYGKSGLPNGMLLGLLNLVNVIKYEDSDSWIADKIKHKCYWTPEQQEFPKYGYLINPGIIKFKNPIPYSGNLGFWNIPTSNIIEEIPKGILPIEL